MSILGDALLGGYFAFQVALLVLALGVPVYGTLRR